MGSFLLLGPAENIAELFVVFIKVVAGAEFVDDESQFFMLDTIKALAKGSTGFHAKFPRKKQKKDADGHLV
jgi:hypothetical protein